MKRDLDLLRKILLFIEEKHSYGQSIMLQDFSELNRPYEEIAYHLDLLDDENYIDVTITRAIGVFPYYSISRITFEGHDYLDVIRNDTIWNKVKDKVTLIGGSTSLAIIKELAVVATKDYLGLK